MTTKDRLIKAVSLFLALLAFVVVGVCVLILFAYLVLKSFLLVVGIIVVAVVAYWCWEEAGDM